MSVDLGFRKFVRAWMEFQGTPPIPIPTLANPSTIELNPGIEQGEIETTSCTGERTIALTYADAIKGTITLGFPTAAPDLMSMVLNRRFGTSSNINVMVPLEVQLETGVTSYAGKSSGQLGFDIVAQVAASTTATAYYVDSATKLRQAVTIVDSAPSGNQITIGNAGAVTTSTTLAATNKVLYILCPATISGTSTILTSTTLPLVTVYLVGIHFDQSVQLVKARNCSFLPGGTLNNEPQKEVSLRILRDPSDGTGLGFSMQVLNRTASC